MDIHVGDLNVEHPAVRAAIMMVDAHKRHGTIVPAMEEVQAAFPELDRDQIVLLWIGVNAKDREGKAS